MAALALLHQARLPQGAHDGPVQQQGQCRVDAALGQVEGGEHSGQHSGHHSPGHAHVEGGDHIVPDHHADHQHHHAQAQAQHGALLGMVLPIEPGRRHREGAGGDDVHNKAVGAGSADGDHLNKGDDHGNGHAGQGSQDEPGDNHHRVLGVIAQKARHRGHDPADQHRDEADGGEHADNGHGSG